MNTAEALTNHVFTRIQELESVNEVADNKLPYHILCHPESPSRLGMDLSSAIRHTAIRHTAALNRELG